MEKIKESKEQFDVVKDINEPPNTNRLILKGIIEELKMLVQRLEKL